MIYKLKRIVLGDWSYNMDNINADNIGGLTGVVPGRSKDPHNTASTHCGTWIRGPLPAAATTCLPQPATTVKQPQVAIAR